MKRPVLIGLAAVVVAAAAVLAVVTLSKKGSTPTELTKLSLRLQWVPQSQFCGFIVAKQKDFYKDASLDVELRPAGPDLKPQVTVAVGTDDIGIGVANHVIGARSNGVPLVAIAQIFQDSPNRYVLKAENRIGDLRDLRGKKIGLWLGGDEAEFISMLATVGMTLSDLTVIPQEFSVIPFLQDEYILSQVTVYNELNLIRAQGYKDDKLQVLSPKDYDSAILGDVILTTENYLRNNLQTVTAFLEASLRGWRYCLDHPDEAVRVVVAYNPELEEEDQRLQLKAALSLLTSGAALEHGLGYLDVADYAIAERVLFKSAQITTHVDPKTSIDLSAWHGVSSTVKRID
ncbi:MAG: ABC transporter substrate-binding protein [Gammaproteobacteria bacterium]